MNFNRFRREQRKAELAADPPLPVIMTERHYRRRPDGLSMQPLIVKDLRRSLSVLMN
jgi:hypothetical protein